MKIRKTWFLWFMAIGILAVLPLIIYICLPLSKEIFANSQTSLKITDRHGILLREVLSPDGGRNSWLSYQEFPEIVVNAVINTEDKRFFSHIGIDIRALGRAMIQNLRSRRVVSGASTITQQLVKQRFGYPRTLAGKIHEMLMALRVERQFSKPEILTHYLNRVSFSNQVFGIDAAARLYFGKPARHLSLAESVFLAGIIQAPSRLNPYSHFAAALKRQKQLIEQMYQRKLIDQTSYQIAKREELRVIPRQVNFKAPHFCEVILSKVAAQVNSLSVIKTTLNYYLQEKVEEIIATRIDELKEYNVTNAAVLVLNNYNGDILAFAGSRDFFDESIAGQVNGVLALRQPGSTLKPFTYHLALEHGYTAATLIPDIQEYPAAPRSFLPENYDRKFHGPVRLREALACSYNIPAFRVLQDIGVDALYQRLREFGFESLQELPSFYGPGLTLGDGEVTLLELVKAYSIFARRGKAMTERYILALNHQPVEPPAPERQIFPPQGMYLMTHILADRQSAIPAFGENTPLNLPFQTAVKTGTSKDYRDNWTIGFTRDYTVGVWVGNFDGTPMRKVSGITGASPIYRDVMLALYRYFDPYSVLADPPSSIVRARICPLSGELINQDCPHTIDEIFLEGSEPTQQCQIHKAYWVDARDGLLTDPASPNAVKKVFTHFPPMYQAWARDNGFPDPPAQRSPFEDARKEDALAVKIVHPNDGDVYAIDPVLRREYQTIQLSAVVESGVSEVFWYVDGKQYETVQTPFQADWAITPGAHRIHAEGQRDGTPVRSQDITIYVVE